MVRSQHTVTNLIANSLITLNVFTCENGQRPTFASIFTSEGEQKPMLAGESGHWHRPSLTRKFSYRDIVFVRGFTGVTNGDIAWHSDVGDIVTLDKRCCEMPR